MATAYNTIANDQGLSKDEMSASVGNLLDPSDPAPAHFSDEKYFNFDIAAVGLGFHHFEDPVLAATRLAERLKPGGVLLILDFLPHAKEDFTALSSSDHDAGEGSSSSGGHGHEHGHGHGHHHFHLGHKHDEGMEVKVEPDQLKKSLATVQHHGFSEADIKAAFVAAGVGEGFKYDVLARQVVFKSAEKTMKRSVFMARGTKG
jgi:SAM-dependent methyltransferase